MRKLAMVVAAAILSVLVPMASAADQKDVKYPYVGELTGDHVRIRAGGGLNYQILTQVSTGAKVLVREQRGDWMRIRIPQQASLWISAKYVTASGAGMDTVKGDRVNVRARKETGDILGQMQRGETVSVRGREGDWLKIAPPDRISGWISAKYVRYVGQYDEMKAMVEAEDQINDLMGQARDLYEGELKKEPEARDFAKVIALYEKIAAQAPSDAAKKEALSRRDLVASIKQVNDSFVEAMKPYKGVPDKLAELEGKYNALFEKAAPPEYTATGWVDTLGKVAFRPGTHKLVKDGKTLYILKSDDYDLEEYRGKYVGVIGQVDPEKSLRGVPVLSVDQIDLLYEKGGKAAQASKP